MSLTIAREEIARTLQIDLDNVALRAAGSLSRHIAINGTSYCGRLNNDGYNIASEFDLVDESLICKTCFNRYNSKVGA